MPIREQVISPIPAERCNVVAPKLLAIVGFSTMVNRILSSGSVSLSCSMNESSFSIIIFWLHDFKTRGMDISSQNYFSFLISCIKLSLNLAKIALIEKGCPPLQIHHQNQIPSVSHPWQFDVKDSAMVQKALNVDGCCRLLLLGLLKT